MVYNGKCATDQAQRRGVKRSAGPYTGLFHPHPRLTDLGMRVESVLHPNLPSTHLGHTPEMTPAGMVYNGKCATDQAQRRGVKRSAGPYTGLFYPHLRATELGMRVESALNINAPQFALHSPGPHTEMTPAGMVYNGKCATDQAKRRGVERSAGPYTGLFYPHRRATELGMRVESGLNINAPQFALHSPGPHTRDDPSRHGVRWKVCNRSRPTPWSETECWPIHRPILSIS